MEVEVEMVGRSAIAAIIGVVTVKVDRGSQELVLVVVVVLRGGGSREETLGGAVGGDVLEALQVRDDCGDDDEGVGGDVGGFGFVL